MDKEAAQYFSAANRALSENRLDDAVAGLQQALALAPNSPDGWYNLGYALRVSRRFTEALSAYDCALTHGISNPEEVHVNRAAIFSEHLSRDQDAEAELRRALDSNPRFVIAWNNLGNVYEDAGDLLSARGAYQNTLGIEPHNGRALSRIAAMDIFDGRPSAIIPDLQSAMANPAMSADDATDIAFALANALDADGRYDEAFQLLMSANRADLAMRPPHERYGRDAQERMVDDLCQLPPPQPSQPQSEDGPAPVFICGPFRSGSTLIEQMLGRHHAIVAGGELDAIPAYAHEKLRPYPGALASLSTELLGQLRKDYMDRIRAIAGPCAIVTDKRCDNFLHIYLIKMLFPNAKIIHTRRNACDTMLSAYFLRFGEAVPYGNDLDDYAHWHGQYQKLMAHWGALFANDIHEIYYEDVVRDPENALHAAVNFLGLAWDPACLSSGDVTAQPIKTASAWQVRQALHQRSSGRWRNYVRYLAGYERLLG
ncbi:MAG: sulfotransferase [Sphingopyxis sp.]